MDRRYLLSKFNEKKKTWVIKTTEKTLKRNNRSQLSINNYQKTIAIKTMILIITVYSLYLSEHL